MAINALTELDAVNTILRSRGLTPVQTIEGATSKNTQIALDELRATSREIQRRGWGFNFEPYYTLSVDSGSGKIPIPDSIVRFVVPGEPWLTIVRPYLKDKKENTFVFTQAKEGAAIVLREWAELPEAAQAAITARAARKIYDKYVGSDQTRQTLFLEESEMYEELQQWDTETEGYNMLHDNALPGLMGSDYVPGAPNLRYY